MESNSITPLLVVGTIGIDTVSSPFGKAERVLGGSAMYFAAAASLLAPVNVVSVVGEDFGPERWKEMSHPEVDLSGVATLPGNTFAWGGLYHKDINRRDTLFTELGVLERFNPVLPENYRSCGAVFLANVDPASQLKVLDSIEEPEFVVLDTMNYWISSDRQRLEEVIARSDVMIINDDEARELTGQLNLPSAIEEIQQMGPRIVVVKKGEHGAMLAEGDDFFSLPGLPLKAVCDPTGAGDSFAGGFMGYIQRSGSRSNATLRTAVAYASSVASFCCEDFSAERLWSLTLEELEARAEQFRRMVEF
jgi:sugar/nucleoside kinase (ribokinase family)